MKDPLLENAALRLDPMNPHPAVYGPVVGEVTEHYEVIWDGERVMITDSPIELREFSLQHPRMALPEAYQWQIH